ncbi:MAG: DUF2291 domain-containing protein [Mycobacteriales bacterium]
MALPLALCALLTLTGCTKVPGVYVAEKDGGAASQAGSSGKIFDPKSYVEKNWDSKVVPAVTDKSEDASTVLAALAANPAAASQKYGRQNGTGSPYAFLVKGTGKVVSVDRSATGSLLVDLAPGDGKPDLSIAIGPAFVGTAIRDAVGFIKFSQFTNQIDYADVSTALNTRVRTTVVGGKNFAGAAGKTVTFAGAFQLLDPKHIVVTPVTLDVAA